MTSPYEIRVPAIGPLDAKIVLVGEGPGTEELARGEPFVGPAGQQLDRFLESAGLARSDCYITNITKTLPRFDNEKDEFFFNTVRAGKNKIISRTPTMPYMEGILEVVSEIRSIKANGGANVVVPLGNYALWGLAQTWGITNWRGSIIESVTVPGTKLVPTLHPAFYLRNEGQPQKKLLGNWDFVRIAQQAQFPEIRKREHNWIINPTPDQIDEAVERYTRPGLDHVTADTEWYSPDSLAYLSFADNPKETICIEPNSMHAFRAIQKILSSPIPKVWQNAMFDAVALWRQGIKVENVAHDTMIAWYMCWGITIEAKGLDVITSVLTEEPFYKEDVEFVHATDEEGRAKGRIYCCTDSSVTDEAYTKLINEEFPYCGTRKGYDISMSIMNTFIRAAQKGIKVDRERLERIRAERLERANELEDSVSRRVGRTINCRSWQQVQPVVYDDLGYGKRFTERSTDQKKLMEIAATLYAENPADENVQLLIDIIRVRQDRNIVSRYINENIVDKDGRTRSFWNLAGTKNGRLSTSDPWWNGVALQTMPEDAREICVADPGHIFVGWDLGQAEARVVAVLAHDFELLDDMARGLDIHLKMAAALPFGLSYDEHYAAMKAVMAEGKSKDQYAPRFLAKRTRHASNYIQSWMGLMQQINKDFLDTMIGVNASLAKMLSNGFLEACPGLPGWWKNVRDTVNDQGFLVNDFGRRRNWYDKVYYQDHEHKDAVAFQPQSDVADLTTQTIAELDKVDWVFPMLHMHDGGLVQVPIERKDEAIELVRHHATREFRVKKELLTIPVDMKVGFDWKNLEAA